MEVLTSFQCRKMVRICSIFLLFSTILQHVESAKNDHPYAFEKPLSETASFITHKLGLPFVERKTKFVRKEETELIDEDSDRNLFEKSDRNVMERDRTSSAGETEIRSQIFRNSTNSVDKKRDQDVVDETSSVDKHSVNLSTNDSTSTVDLSTSQSIPVAQSLRGNNKDSFYRLKSKLKSELSKPVKPIKHKPDYDDDEYYYTYDDDDYYYDEPSPPKSTKMSNSRKNFDSKSKISSSYYKKPSLKETR